MEEFLAFIEKHRAYRGHLRELWLRPTGSDKTIDESLRAAYETSRSALVDEGSPLANDLIETGDYVIDCYVRLVDGKSVAGLAEAEGGYNYYLRKIDMPEAVAAIRP
jgi:hypothetical protein